MLLKVEKKSKVTSSKDVAKIFSDILAAEDEIDRDKEHFWVAGLSNANRVVYVELVTLGLLNQTLIAPREVFRLAVMRGVARIMAVHNHPSGTVRPSPEDVSAMKTLKNAGTILGIKLLDFIIITDGNAYWSASDDGQL